MKDVDRDAWLNGVGELGAELMREARRHPEKVWPSWENFPVKVALMHAELSEALEVHRCAFVGLEVRIGGGAEAAKRLFALKKMEAELADVLILVVQTAAGLGMKLGEAVLRKTEANWERAVMHGGKSY